MTRCNDPYADYVIREIRHRRNRRGRWLREQEISMARRIARIGVPGVIFIVPTLAGLYLGLWLDAHLHTGIYWSATVMVLGFCFGGWTALKWMNI